jgi:N-acetylneuraminic acid mutarotase
MKCKEKAEAPNYEKESCKQNVSAIKELAYGKWLKMRPMSCSAHIQIFQLPRKTNKNWKYSCKLPKGICYWVHFHNSHINK